MSQPLSRPLFARDIIVSVMQARNELELTYLEYIAPLHAEIISCIRQF